jgi:hypothetical protein
MDCGGAATRAGGGQCSPSRERRDIMVCVPHPTPTPTPFFPAPHHGSLAV